MGDFMFLDCKDVSCILLYFHLFVGWCCILFLLISVFFLCIVRFVVYWGDSTGRSLHCQVENHVRTKRIYFI